MLRERLQLHPFWQLENLGFIRPYGLGADEWGNRSFYIVIPLLGSLTIAYSARSRDIYEHVGVLTEVRMGGT